MPTFAEIETALSPYAGANQSFVQRLNLVRARLMQAGNWPGTKQLLELAVYSDLDGYSIITLPRQFKAILAGAVRNESTLCSGQPFGVRNEWADFSRGGLGYGGMSDDFQEVTGRYCVFQEWLGSMKLQFDFEANEDAGSIHVRGQMNGDKVFSYDGDSSSWIEGEKVAINGSTPAKGTKFFGARGLSVVKPVTKGRVTMSTIDTANTLTVVAVYEPNETVISWRRYRVPQCAGSAVLNSDDDDSGSGGGGGTPTTDQFFTKDEILAMFADGGTITVSATGTHDLAYDAYLTRQVKITATAGAGAYVHDFTLDSAVVKAGGTLRVKLDMVASANPTLRFYDNTTGGTLLTTVIGDSDNVTDYTLVFSFDGTNWTYDGREI